MSLQNALDIVRGPLSNVPQYGTREVLFLMSALSTCDPGDVFASIGACKKARVRCSVIGMAAEMHICRSIADSTGGSYQISQNQSHLEELLMTFASPPPSLAQQTPSSLVNMGFPGRAAGGAASALCACHREVRPGPHYVCPRCKCRVCDLPAACPICSLTLVSSPHLARSYHHLFPVTPFAECEETPINAICFACHSLFIKPLHVAAAGRPDMVLECTKCKQQFCSDCDMFIHETLHNCPGCELLANTSLQD